MSPETAMRDLAITKLWIQHVPTDVIAAQFGVTVHLVNQAKNRTLAAWRTEQIDKTADDAMVEYDEVIREAWKKFNEPSLKVTPAGKTVMHPETGDPVVEYNPEFLRIINQALAGQRAMRGWDAPKKRITVSYKLEEIKQQLRELAPTVLGELESGDDGEAVV